MSESDIQFVYVVDDSNKLQGYYLAEEVEKATTLEGLVRPIVKSFFRRSFVQEIISMVDESDIDVPIVDVNGRLRGLINGSDILKIMK
jgi:Mg/Co/Ni transporter MgtE